MVVIIDLSYYSELIKRHTVWGVDWGFVSLGCSMGFIGAAMGLGVVHWGAGRFAWVWWILVGPGGVQCGLVGFAGVQWGLMGVIGVMWDKCGSWRCCEVWWMYVGCLDSYVGFCGIMGMCYVGFGGGGWGYAGLCGVVWGLAGLCGVLSDLFIQQHNWMLYSSSIFY